MLYFQHKPARMSNHDFKVLESLDREKATIAIMIYILLGAVGEWEFVSLCQASVYRTILLFSIFKIIKVNRDRYVWVDDVDVHDFAKTLNVGAVWLLDDPP